MASSSRSIRSLSAPPTARQGGAITRQGGRSALPLGAPSQIQDNEDDNAPEDTQDDQYLDDRVRNTGIIMPVEPTLEELQLAAKAARQTATLAAARKLLLQTAMNILYSQGEEMTLHCNEIESLNLKEEELKTLMREYALQPGLYRSK